MNQEDHKQEIIPLNQVCQISKIKNTTYVVTGTYAGNSSLETKITNILRREMEETDARTYGT